MKTSNLLLAKTILFGLVLSTVAAMPLLLNFLPCNVDYNKSTKAIILVPGQNRIDDVAITLDQSGKALHAEQIDRQVINRVFGFRNLRAFLIAGAPFFSLLAFCFFFLWYDKQQKDRYVITLKKYLLGIFSYVSIWFIYRFVISRPVGTTYTSYYPLGIYTLTAVSLALVCYLHCYCHKIFKHKRLKIASVISYIFEIRYKHYPRVAHRALHKKEALQETHQQIQDYENQTFEVLEEVQGQPVSSILTKRRKAKFILIGIVLSALAIMPLLYQLVPKHVDYKETTQTISLKPGLNKIDNIALILNPEGKVLKAQKTKRQIVHKVLGFKNLKVFLGNVAPFLSSLCLCLFFFWYEQQQKTPYVLALKRYVCVIFFFVSIWFTYWTLAPQNDPISHNFYNVGSYVIICVGLAALCYVLVYGNRFVLLCSKMLSLILYVFNVSKRHYPRMAIKAMDKREDYEETCADIEEYDRQTEKVINGVKEFIVGPKLEKEYDDYKSNKIDL